MSYIVGASQQLIGQQILGGTSATITFSSIPQNFNHLKLVVMARTNTAVPAVNIKCTINGDSGSNYDYQYIAGNNIVSSAAAAAGGTLSFIGSITAATASANYSGLIESTFFCYKNTTFFKSILTRSGYATASTGVAQFVDILTSWRNTAAITSIALTDASAGSFIAGSSFYLYGVL